jgi:uracil-DNA glycosylase
VEQGVLLLNATLTVRQDSPRSHQGKGWEKLTDAIVRAVKEKREHVVFLLWGRDAQEVWGRCARENGTPAHDEKHLVLETSHPSEFSAHRGFRGCRHFKTANDYLEKHGLEPIDWQKIGQGP